MSIQQKLERAIQLHQRGNLADAEMLYAQILELEPRNFTACHFLGVIRYQQSRAEDATRLISAALSINPASPVAHANYGLALQARGQLAEALAAFDRSLALKPADPETHNNRGLNLAAMERLPEALAAFEHAARLNSSHVEALNNRGNVLARMNRIEEALTAFDAAIAVQPRFADALNNRGNALLALARGEEALASYNLAIAARPDFADAYYNRGQPLMDAMRVEEALASYDRAIALRANFAKALNGRAIALQKLERIAEALASYDAALKIAPDLAIAKNRASLLLLARRFEEAKTAFRAALEIGPDDGQAFAGLAAAALYSCDWSLVRELAPDVRRRVEKGRAVIDPLVLTGYFDDAALQCRATENYQHDRVPLLPPPLPAHRLSAGGRIRLAYLSGDFHTHAIASLVVGLLESHDRDHFEVHVVSYGPDDASAMRARIKAGVEFFHDVRALGDQAIAKLLAEREIGVVIDLKGHTQGERPAILSFRPAPVQVSYLGFPGTTGAAYMDYLIADRIVLPPEQQALFREQIVYLPHCYQANDSKRVIANAPGRAEAGLPDHAFVFCCFNNSWKISADVFDVWMRLLKSVPDSVLWLLKDNEGACNNLRRSAEARGVAAERLVFAPFLPEAQHLARQRLADLFLDTQPYNAHTTGSDALWGGLPLLTCEGMAFPARVGASLLHAGGLPELVTHTLPDYEATALRLARNPDQLGALKQKLVMGRLTVPLFDTDRFRRDIESAYRTMWERALHGRPPQPFAVGPS